MLELTAHRSTVVEQLAQKLADGHAEHTTRVAVDGVTASGKTTLAGEIGASVAARGRPVIRLSMDGFHHPRSHRYRQGRGSADGYYEDAYDFASFATAVLCPLGPGGSGYYRPAIIDLATDTAVDGAPVAAPRDAILIVDGSFLQRDELRDEWDVRIFVATSFENAAARGVARDAALLGGRDQAADAFATRYHAAGRRYLTEVDPRGRADLIFVNDDLSHPTLHWSAD